MTLIPSVYLCTPVSLVRSLQVTLGWSAQPVIHKARQVVKSTAVEADQLHFAIQQGLKPDILSQVIRRQPNMMDELLKVSLLAEATTTATFDRILAEVTASRQIAKQNAQHLQRMVKQPVNTNMINEVGSQPAGSTTPKPPQPRRAEYVYNAPSQPRRSLGVQRHDYCKMWKQGVGAMNTGARPSRPMDVQMTQLPMWQ